MGIHPKQLRDCIIFPVLDTLGLPNDKADDGKAASQLLLGTAAQESQCGFYLEQIQGPAKGIWQMEPATFWSHIDYIKTTSTLDDILNKYLVKNLEMQNADVLVGNLFLACAFARIHYYRVRDPLPRFGDIEAQARYYKQYYNTPFGAATVEQYMKNWQTYCGFLYNA